jgi:hypothetical protein
MKRLGFVATVLVAVVASVGLATPAHAAVGNLLVNVRWSDCLSADSPIPGTRVGHFICDDVNQRWIGDPVGLVNVGGSFPAFRLRSESTGLCIDVAGNGTASGTALVLNGCNGFATQQWAQIPDGGVYYFVNVWTYQRTFVRRVIDVPSSAESNFVRLWTYNRTTAQQFVVL